MLSDIVIFSRDKIHFLEINAQSNTKSFGYYTIISNCYEFYTILQHRLVYFDSRHTKTNI